MAEVAIARKHHRHATFIGSRNHLLVTHGTTRWLASCPGLSSGYQTIGKRKKGIATRSLRDNPASPAFQTVTAWSTRLICPAPAPKV